MKQRVEEMEKEAMKLREMQAEAEKVNNDGLDAGVPMETDEDKAAADSRSVYVGNVSTVPPFGPCVFFSDVPNRLTTVPHRKRSRVIFRLVEQ